MANSIKFDPVILDQNDVQTRQVLDLLPAIHQTDTLKRFFGASLNHLFNPGSATQINGYIGQQPLYYDINQDFYITEPTASRKFYQLEATMVGKDDSGNVRNLLFYPDIVNQLRFQGALVTNHNRLFEQNYYTWCPPINIDKLVNFRNYFWIGSDLPIDYLVLQSGSSNLNPWSENNLWSHKNNLTDIERAGILTRATRPIIEFDKDLELYNYGLSRRSSVYVCANSLDLFNLVARANTANHVFLMIDDIVLDPTMGTLKILILNDRTIELNNLVVAISFDNDGKIIVSLEIDGLDPLGGGTFGEIIKISNGTLYGNQEVYFNGTTWIFGQQKSGPNISPLFNLYDTNNNLLSNSAIYPENNFIGNKIFTYHNDTSGTSTIDSVLGIRLTFDSNGQINFENYLATTPYSYSFNNVVTKIEGFRFHRSNIGTTSVYNNDWYPAGLPSRQMIVDQYLCDGVNNIFAISQKPDIDKDGVINLEVSRISPTPNTAFSILTESSHVVTGDYVRTDNSIIFKNTQVGDVIKIKTFSTAQPFVNATGFYEVPNNLRANPNNEQVSIISSGDYYQQFNDILSSQDDRSKGRSIVQNEGNLLLLGLTLQDSNLDFMNAARYSETEYLRFRNKFEQRITNYFKLGKTTLSDNWTDEWIDDALNELSKGKTQTFPFANTKVAYDSNHQISFFIPSTPSALGIYPISIPGLVIDFTFESVFDNVTDTTVPQIVIRNHDGSLTPSYGKYQVDQTNVLVPYKGIIDPRDAVILRLETRIHNTINLINPQFIANERPVFDWLIYYSAFSRRAEYSYQEYLSFLQPNFDRWVTQYNLDFRVNSNFVASDPFTWNWSQVTGVDGELLPGHWRGICFYYFDTDRPHTAPWQMLGFTNKPAYWDSTYGVGPYTSNNVPMWRDLENGYIAQGLRQGIHPQWARNNLSKYIPVDEIGNLLDPVQMGIAQNYPAAIFASSDWKFGDCGPIESSWRRSPLFGFAVAQAAYLMKPARFFGAYWDSGNYAVINNQVLDKSTNDRPQNSELFVHGETDSSGNVTVKYGIQQWISDYLVSLNQNVTTALGDPIRGLNVQLAYKMAGFTQSTDLLVSCDAFDRIPNEDVVVKLYQSPSIREEFYSGVIVSFDGKWFKVYGYDILKPVFNVIQPNTSGPGYEITYGNAKSVGIPNWTPGSFYVIGSLINHLGLYYSCVRSHTASIKFEPTFWSSVTRPTFQSNDTVMWFSDTVDDSIISSVPYGSRFSSMQDIANFLNGLQRYYVSRGWIFDNFINDYVSNWAKSCLEFLAWFDDHKTIPGSFIALNPASSVVKFDTDHGEAQSVEQFINGTYSLIDRGSKPIPPNQVDIARHDGQLIITPTSNLNGGIFGCRVYISEIEHVIIFKNTTIFNNTIYNPFLNIRQPRVRIQGFKTTNWHGRLNAPGFIVNNNVLLPNFEKSVDDFRHLFDIETVNNATLQQRARNNVGFSERDYLRNLLMTPTNQFEFYQGMIQQKGTPTVMTRLLRSNFIRNNTDIQFLEEWLFRVADYGSVTINPSFDLQLMQCDVTTDPQLITFDVIQPSTIVVPQTNVIQIVDIVGVKPQRDPRWVWQQFSSQIDWNTVQFPQKVKGFLPNCGYANVDTISWTALDRIGLVNLYYSTLLAFPSIPIQRSYSFSYDGITVSPKDVTVAIIPNLTQGFLRINKVEFTITEGFVPNSMAVNVGRVNNPQEFARASPEMLNLAQNTTFMPSGLFELNNIDDNTIYIQFTYQNLLQTLGINIGHVMVTVYAEQFIDSVLPNHRVLVYNDSLGNWNTYKLQDTRLTIKNAFVPSFPLQGTPISYSSVDQIITVNDLLLLDGVINNQSQGIEFLFDEVYNPVFKNTVRTVIDPVVVAAAVVDPNNNNSIISIFQMLSSAGMVIDNLTFNVIDPFSGGAISPKIQIGTNSVNDYFVKSFTPINEFIENNSQVTLAPSFAINVPVEIDIFDTTVAISPGQNLVSLQILRSGNIYNSLVGITVTNSGSNYVDLPQVAITGPQGAQAIASLAGGVNHILITNGGTGYTSAPLVIIVGANGLGAQGTASIAGGIVTGINLTASGNGYTIEPTVILSGGNGFGATAVTTVNYGVASIAVTSTGGCVYDGTSTPTIVISGGGGSGATATPQLNTPLLPMTVNWRYYQNSPTITGWTEGGSITFQPVGNIVSNPTDYWLKLINLPIDNSEETTLVYQIEIYNSDLNDTSYQIINDTATITVVKTETGNDSVDLTIRGNTVISGFDCPSDDMMVAYLNTNGNVGTVVINVNYHYDSGFEVFYLDGTPKTIENEGSGGRILGWYPTRFPTIASRDATVIPSGWSPNDVVEVDYVPNVLDSGGWTIYKNSMMGIWNPFEIENLKVDSSQFVNATIYNKKTNEILETLQLFDPYQGYIVGTADRELTYKLNYDPAIYNMANNPTIPTSPQYCWGLSEVNQLWWDLSTVRYIDYQTSTIPYRWKNWGRLAPQASIGVYQWVRSPVPPSNWSLVVASSNVYPGFETTPTTGTVGNPSVCGWVQQQEWIPALNREAFVYYFWVKDIVNIPTNSNRQLSTIQVATIIANPSSQDVAWFAVLDSNKLILGGIRQYLDDVDTVLSLNWKINKNEGNHHKQWKIIRENDPTTGIELELWNKLRDSLIGWDDFTPIPQTVPDPLLTPKEAIGTLIRPRQTWFTPDSGNIPSRYARKVFVEAFNNLMQAEPYIDNWFQWQNVFGIIDPAPGASNYTFTALTLDIRDYYASSGNMNFGQTVFVPGVEQTNNFWTIWSYDSNNVDSGKPNFTLIQAQKYAFVENYLWNRVDWYDSNWCISDYPLYHYADRNAFNVAPLMDDTLLKGTLIMIDHESDLDPRWSWQVYQNGKYIEVAKQAATIALSDVFYDSSKVTYAGPGRIDSGWDNKSWDSLIFDVDALYNYNIADISNRDGSWEIRTLLNNIPVTLFSQLQMNKLFFAMTKCALSMNHDIDWIIKSSFVSIGGYAEPLKQNPLAYAKQLGNLVAYVEEVKPYHVKLRDLSSSQYAVNLETGNMRVSDFDGGLEYANSILQAKTDAQLQVTAQFAAEDLALALHKSSSNSLITPFVDLSSDGNPWNGLRHVKIRILFDRVSDTEPNNSGWDQEPWDFTISTYLTNVIPGAQANEQLPGTPLGYYSSYQLSPTEYIILNDNYETATLSKWDMGSEVSAAGRINQYYNSKDFGINSSDVIGKSRHGYIDGGPAAYGLLDQFTWDFEGGWANESAYYDGSDDSSSIRNTFPDNQLPGEMTPILVDEFPGDLNIDAGGFKMTTDQIEQNYVNFDSGYFIDPSIQGSPEELVNLRLNGTILITALQNDSGIITTTILVNQ